MRAYLGMFLSLDVSRIATVRNGDSSSLYWRSGASIGVYGRSYGVELCFARDGNQTQQSVVVERLRCHFGGNRPLLHCPRCDRRCRRIYLCGSRFTCRICTRAPYWTQTASPDARMAYRIRRLQSRLAPEEDPDDYVVEWVPRRPRGMRRATYRRLVGRLEQVNDRRDSYLEPGLLRAIARLISPEELAVILDPPA